MDGTAVFEAARRGWIPRRDAHVLGVWRKAYDPAKVEDQVQLLTRILQTLELDGQATGCNPDAKHLRRQVRPAIGVASQPQVRFLHALDECLQPCPCQLSE
jgi:hypothetical protein